MPDKKDLKTVHNNYLQVQTLMALRHSLWIRRFSIQDRVGFYEDIHTKQRRATLIDQKAIEAPGAKKPWWRF
jgi:hypothetical protein